MKIAIQGHPTRGKEVIQILESLGGKNIAAFIGVMNFWYYIDSDGHIRNDYEFVLTRAGFKTYTLEEFEKEFPFKVGDRVISTTTNFIGTITKLKESGYYIKYDNGNIAFTPGQHLKLYKEMKEERNITLTLDKAKEWYKKGGELREIALQAFSEKELTKVGLPKSWKEFCKNYPIENGESYITIGCSIVTINKRTECRDIEMDRNYCPSRKSAEAHLAMIQLEQLRDCWLDGWKPKWDASQKWCIRLYKNQLHVGLCTDISSFLTFPTREMAEEFLECFRDLIEKAGDLI